MMSDNSSFISHHSSLLMRTLRPYLGLLFLALVAFWPLVLHPTQTLYSDSSDLLAQHLPAKYFLVRSLRETGELPLWNPEQYSGSPFVHDIQVGLFYPPHLPLYFVSEPAIGPFVSWLLFVHVLLAGCFMFAYARHAGLSELAAFVAGVGFMLSPRWMMQLFLAGHIVTQGICWLPLVLLCVERAFQRKRWSWAVGGGVAYATLILGTHPQWTFYASLLIGFWPLRLLSPPHRFGEEAGERGLANTCSRRNFLLRWLAVEAIVVAIGISLCAVQLLPTFEAAGQSSRARGMGQSWSLDGAKAAFGTLIGPMPEKVAEPIHWETRSGIGFTWAILAVVGIRMGGRKTLVPAIITGGILTYALGGSYFIDRLPGFDNFRMPTRMLLMLAFPVAYFTAKGVQSLVCEPESNVLRDVSAIWVLVFASVGTILYVTSQLGVWHYTTVWWTYWVVMMIGACLFWLSPYIASKLVIPAIMTLLVADLLILATPLPETKAAEKIYPRSEVIDHIRENNPDGGRVHEWNATERQGCLLGPGSPVASVYGIPSTRGYNPLDVARYRTFLDFVANDRNSDAAFSSEFKHPVVPAFFPRNVSLYHLLGIRFDVLGSNAGFAKTVQEPLFAYNFLGPGIERLPHQYVTDRNYGRAYFVSNAVPQAGETEVLSQLKSLDLDVTATLESWDPAVAPMPQREPGIWKIRSHKPNEVTCELDGSAAGLLVLTDPWYPGWVCRIDGTEVPIWKADYAFRGVMVPEGSREVVFHFEPQSYRRGKWISLVALIGIGLLFFSMVIRRATIKLNCRAIRLAVQRRI